jgi:hypothetical protein
MSQVKLAEMDAADMLDVIHYLYEEDVNYVSPEQQQYADQRRVSIWNSMYKIPYKYSATKENADIFNSPIGDDEDIDFTPFSASRSNNVKPYFPPTDFSAEDGDPFGGVLDAPIGG